jgi:hypothetical protein
LSTALQVESSLELVRFHATDGSVHLLSDVPTLPGGHLSGRFAFRVTEDAGAGRFDAPRLSLFSDLTAQGGDNTKRGCGKADSDTCHSIEIHILSFDASSGAGTAEFRLAMIAANGLGPPLFEAENRVELFLGVRGQMRRGSDGVPEHYVHKFEPVLIYGRNSALAVVVQRPEINIAEDTEVTVILDKSAATSITLAIEAEFSEGMPCGCGSECLQFPRRLTIEVASRTSTFRMRFMPSKCGAPGGMEHLR